MVMTGTVAVMAAMAGFAMMTAGMFAVMTMMIARDIGVKGEGSCQKGSNRIIGITLNAAVQSDARFL